MVLVLLGVAGAIENAVFLSEADALVMLAWDGIGLRLLIGARNMLLS